MDPERNTSRVLGAQLTAGAGTISEVFENRIEVSNL